MKMFVAFMFGVAGLGSALLFCDPVRDKAECTLFGEGLAGAAGEVRLTDHPLTDAAQTAGQALKDAWGKASDAVASKRDKPAGAALEEGARSG